MAYSFLDSVSFLEETLESLDLRYGTEILGVMEELSQKKLSNESLKNVSEDSVKRTFTNWDSYEISLILLISSVHSPTGIHKEISFIN